MLGAFVISYNSTEVNDLKSSSGDLNFQILPTHNGLRIIIVQYIWMHCCGINPVNGKIACFFTRNMSFDHPKIVLEMFYSTVLNQVRSNSSSCVVVIANFLKSNNIVMRFTLLLSQRC